MKESRHLEKPITLVRCAECGLLAMRDFKTRELCETENSVRDRGEMPPGIPGSQHKRFDDSPICVARKVDFQELMSNTGAAKVAEQIYSVCNSERECDRFLRWQPGMTPKEHLQMDMIERQREWQKSVDERDRQWRKEDRDDDRTKTDSAIRSAWIMNVSVGIITSIAAAVLANYFIFVAGK